MFREKTVFILGAGASVHYGYPLGDELIKKFNSDIKDDILVPYEDKDKVIADIEQPDYKLKDIFERIKKPEYSDYLQMDHTDFSSVGSGLFRCNRNNKIFRKIKIKKIHDMKVLLDKTKSFNPISIDSFLQHHETLQEAGKIMIAYSLLKCEHSERLNKEISYKYHYEYQTGTNDWYPHLLHDLISGCSQIPKKILENQIEILTFN